MVNSSSKRKKVIIPILILFGGLLLAELLGLIWLYFSVARYKTFWENKSNETGELTYIALGDSAAQGIGASSPMKGYVGLITKRLEEKTGKKVRIVNLSVTGANIEDYLRVQASQIKNHQPDVVTIEIGANDVKNFEPSKFREQFQEVLATLPEGSYIANMPLFNSRPSSTKPAKEASKIIEEELAKNGKMKFVDLQKQTMEHQSVFNFAPDLFHPNNLSYKNWAEAFWLQIQKAL